MSIVDSFDTQSSAVFSPCAGPPEGFPEIALIAFNRRIGAGQRARGR